MHKPQKQVEAFHKALEIPIGTFPEVRRPKLRGKLIREESKELRRALKEHNLIAVIDGVCDLLVVTYGTAVECGFDVEPFFDEVHRTNMAKQGGGTRRDGKKLKPDGWTPPDIAGVLTQMQGGQP